MSTPTEPSITVPTLEYEALCRDRARLDFLEKAHIALNTHYGTDYGWELIINHNVVRFMSGHSFPRDDGYPGIDLYDAKGGRDRHTTCRDALDKQMTAFEELLASAKP